MPIRITIDIFSGNPNPAGERIPFRSKILLSAFLLCLLFALTVNTNAQQDKRAEAEKVLNEGQALFRQGTAESLRGAFAKCDQSSLPIRPIIKTSKDRLCSVWEESQVT